MTDDEYKQLKATVDRITEHQKRLTASARDADDSFAPVMKGILDLLTTAKQRISDRIDGERPPLNE